MLSMTELINKEAQLLNAINILIIPEKDRNKLMNTALKNSSFNCAYSK